MLQYPALLDQATQALHPLGASQSFLVGRNETADVFVADRSCSRHHFRILRRDGRFLVEPLSARNPTHLNGQPIVAAAPLEHGAVIQAGAVLFQFLTQPATRTTDARPVRPSAVRTPAPPEVTRAVDPAASSDDLLGVSAFPLSGVMIIGRDEERVEIPLPHPQVSRRHACVTFQGSTATITDLHSANGTFVNGVRIGGVTRLTPGDEVDVGPYALRFTGAALVPRPRSDNVELVARGVDRVVRSRETGKPLKLLDDVTLVIRPREFVCLLGPSGSGKSTLLAVLSGRAEADGGGVHLNGKDLFGNFEALKHDIAVVPQKDVLHESLAVGEALWYTARLRLPPDTSRAELEATLGEMLDTVGLSPRRATVIRHLSGGQVKRASLANEILCKPSLLFLDEVTSGLDEQTDREVMHLFRTLADAGKTVVCITHSLANVERTCHLVVILTVGGKLAFVGKPAEALAYFQIDRLGDVYDLVKDPARADHYQQAFLKSPLWKRYVGDRLPPERPAAATAAPAVSATQHLRSLFRQTYLLTTRYAAIWRGDYLSLLAMAGQAFVVALLLGFLFGRLDADSPLYGTSAANLLFLTAVSSFWFGCNNAAKEIVKERTIYTRERDFNLRVSSYYLSKLLLLTFFSAVQTTLLFAMVRLWCGPPGPWFGQLVVLLALALAGVTLGLAISAFAASEEMAITMIPMAVIPQIILSGAIAKLGGLSKLLAIVVVSTYWGKRGLDATLPESVAQAVMPEPLEQYSTAFAVLILLLHAAVAMAAALVVLRWQSRRGGVMALLRRLTG